MRVAIVILAVAVLALAGAGLLVAQNDGPQVLEPPTPENPVVVCGKESGEQYPFATNNAGQRVPISEQECNEWAGIEFGELQPQGAQ